MIICLEGIDGSGKSTVAKMLADEIDALNRAPYVRAPKREKTAYASVFSISDFARNVAFRKNPEEEFLRYRWDSQFKDDFHAVQVVKTMFEDGTLASSIVKYCERLDQALKRLKSGDSSTEVYNAIAINYLEIGALLTPIFKFYSDIGHYIILDRWLWSTVAYNAAIDWSIFYAIHEPIIESAYRLNPQEYAKGLISKILQPDLTIRLHITHEEALFRRTCLSGAVEPLENKYYLESVDAGYDVLASYAKDRQFTSLTNAYGKNILPINFETVEVTHSDRDSEVSKSLVSHEVRDIFFKYYKE
ncbi:dTMP kinase [Campylobacter concisus]|uniref:dTMP kinase n=1 Tax=Campylobacter concisus TaxID=199 RepID=UPI000D304B2B|nr:hypothetical protein [Campylobacter concisus]